MAIVLFLVLHLASFSTCDFIYSAAILASGVSSVFIEKQFDFS